MRAMMFVLPFLGAGAALPAAAIAQTAPAAAPAAAAMPGMAVVDPQGGAVGTVKSVNGAQLIVQTDAHEVQLPVSSFTPYQGKLVFAQTRAQLNAEAAQALAKANASLVAGTKVFGTAGTQAATIEAIDAELVTLKLTSGKLVRVPRSAIAPSAEGAVLGMTAAELDKLAAQAS